MPTPGGSRSRTEVRLDERRRKLTVADGHRQWPYELRVEEILEDGIGLYEKPVERLRESGELRRAADRGQTDDVKSQGAEEGRRVGLRAGLVAAP